jgi:kinesin family protein C2/C3
MDDFKDLKTLLPQSKSMDYLSLKKEFVSQPKFVGPGVDQNDKEDLDLLGFGDADSDERLSDISDGCLSRAETEGSLGSAVEFTLFPESKPSEVAKPAGKAENKRFVCFNSLINLNVLQSFFAGLASYFLVFSDTFFSFQFMSLL